jgi:hypothetical protein
MLGSLVDCKITSCYSRQLWRAFDVSASCDHHLFLAISLAGCRVKMLAHPFWTEEHSPSTRGILGAGGSIYAFGG